MSTLSPYTSTSRLSRRDRSLRLRAGVAKTFGSLFVVLSALLVLPGAVFLHDAVAHPLTADAAQVLMGSTCLAFALLLVVYLVRERR